MKKIAISDLKSFNAADYIVTLEDAHAYLRAALAEADAPFLREALATLAQSSAINLLACKAEAAQAALRRASSRGDGTNYEALIEALTALRLRLTVVAI